LLESIAEFIAPVLKARLERDRFEKSLIESEGELNSLIESMDDMIFHWIRTAYFCHIIQGFR
jgi:hypothetical protein